MQNSFAYSQPATLSACLVLIEGNSRSQVRAERFLQLPFLFASGSHQVNNIAIGEHIAFWPALFSDIDRSLVPKVRAGARVVGATSVQTRPQDQSKCSI
jgi:hypothetical protein